MGGNAYPSCCNWDMEGQCRSALQTMSLPFVVELTEQVLMTLTTKMK